MERITPESLATATVPFCKFNSNAEELDQGSLISADGTDIGDLIDSGDYDIENPYVKMLADLLGNIRGKKSSNSKEKA